MAGGTTLKNDDEDLGPEAIEGVNEAGISSIDLLEGKITIHLRSTKGEQGMVREFAGLDNNNPSVIINVQKSAIDSTGTCTLIVEFKDGSMKRLSVNLNIGSVAETLHRSPVKHNLSYAFKKFRLRIAGLLGTSFSQ